MDMDKMLHVLENLEMIKVIIEDKEVIVFERNCEKGRQ